MEDINNNEIIRECSRVLGHQVEHKPELDTSKIQLVAEVNPKLLRRLDIVKNGSRNSTGSYTLYTTPTDRDFYLTALNLGCDHDVAADSTYVTCTSTLPDGSGVTLSQIYKLSLTATKVDKTITFNPPILLKKGVIIGINQVYTVGAGVMYANIYGYTTDPVPTL